MREQENKQRNCPLCGGRLIDEPEATIPFVFGKSVVIVKDVPAEVCEKCQEAYMTGEVTDAVMQLVQELRSLQAEVSIVSYTAASPVTA